MAMAKDRYPQEALAPLALRRLRAKEDARCYSPVDQGATHVEFMSESSEFFAVELGGVPGVLVKGKASSGRPLPTHAHSTFIPWTSVASVWPSED